MAGQAFQRQFPGAAGFQQHACGIGIDQTGGDGQVFNPELLQFKINRLAMHTDIGDMTAFFDHVLANIPCRLCTHRFYRTIDPAPIGNLPRIRAIASSLPELMVCVAPSSLASARRLSSISTAIICAGE